MPLVANHFPVQTIYNSHCYALPIGYLDIYVFMWTGKSHL
jgi:hypothetical protein